MILLLTTSLLLIETAPPSDTPRLDALQVTQAAAPRSFFFRAAEGMAANPRMQYSRWESGFERLMGIEGKVLDEEIPGRSKRNIEFFTRFKERHPEQLVLLHFNGNARDPRHAGKDFFAGHWLYYNGARVTSDVPATDQDTDIAVSAPELFLTGIGRFQRDNEDIGICALTADGRPDWNRSEQVQLLSVDRQRKTIRVRRGAYGTQPIALKSDQAYAAAHVTEGPWGNKSNLLWAYNYSTVCPRDRRGRQARDILIAELVSWFSAKGPLHAFDGLEFDVLHDTQGRGGRRGADVDADGSADAGVVDAINVYGVGVIEFVKRLRRQLGPDRLILADGHSSAGQRAFHWLNGIESEGFPVLSDHQLRDWSGGLNRHAFWAVNGHSPIWNYINHKFVSHGPNPGQTRQADVPFSAHRLVFAAAVFTDAAVCYSTAPAAEPGELYGIWDELQAGQERQPGWLGRPLGPTIHQGARARDVLGGVLDPPRKSVNDSILGARTNLLEDRSAVEILPDASNAVQTHFQIAPIEAGQRELLLKATLSCDPMTGYPSTRARLLRVEAGWGRSLVEAHPERTGMQRRGESIRPIERDSGAGLSYSVRQTVGNRSLPGYRAHPPYQPKGSVGMTFWECTVDLPTNPFLLVHTGMGPLAPKRSDGVLFRLLVAPLNDKDDVDDDAVWTSRLEHLQKAAEWQRHVISLDNWAGRRVALRFVADAGPNDNATTDHAFWGAVQLGSGRPPEHMSAPQTIMTWVNDRPFTSYFYFDELPSSPITIDFRVEGSARVRLHSLSAHPAPEVVYRRFEHGLVAANLGSRPATIDLNAMAPGVRLRRLRGSSRQDPNTNNGRPVGPGLTLPPRDAIFLMASEANHR